MPIFWLFSSQAVCSWSTHLHNYHIIAWFGSVIIQLYEYKLFYPPSESHQTKFRCSLDTVDRMEQRMVTRCGDQDGDSLVHFFMLFLYLQVCWCKEMMVTQMPERRLEVGAHFMREVLSKVVYHWYWVLSTFWILTYETISKTLVLFFGGGPTGLGRWLPLTPPGWLLLCPPLLLPLSAAYSVSNLWPPTCCPSTTTSSPPSRCDHLFRFRTNVTSSTSFLTRKA